PRGRWGGGWGLLGGGVAFLFRAGLIFFLGWFGGDVGDGTLAGFGHHRPPPMSLSAASQAIALAFIFVIFLGLPLFTIGSIIGAVVGAKKARGRAKGDIQEHLCRTTG